MLKSALFACGFLAGVPLASGQPLSRGQVIEETLHPYRGPTTQGTRVDPSTMRGKILSGYQGWHNAEGDGADRGWFHWSQGGKLEPGQCKFDLWPDMSELGPTERFATPFRHGDGSVAYLYSSYNRETVLRHFKWMADYGLDGVMVQRFITQTGDPKALRHVNTVLDHCREGANSYGRVYAVMYDLSGLGAASMDKVRDDWTTLVDRMKVREDGAYLHHKGKPVVVVWGFGFADGRKYTIAEGIDLVKFLKDDPTYGGNTVVLGIPTYWREQSRDCVKDPHLPDLLKAADIISPWMVGRFKDPDEVRRFATDHMVADLKWCADAGVEYMPVCYPGFSWHNMNAKSPLDQIPRRKGEFLWSQYAAYTAAGCSTLYQAMFDEVDEGTAIYKVTNNPPTGKSSFLNNDGLAPDHYLRLVGEATKRLRSGEAMGDKVPPPYLK